MVIMKMLLVLALIELLKQLLQLYQILTNQIIELNAIMALATGNSTCTNDEMNEIGVLFKSNKTRSH
jgi:hypothetical protein